MWLKANHKILQTAYLTLSSGLENQKYNRDEDYYLVIMDTETGMEIYRQKVIIDIAFADDFGFDI